MFSIAPASTRSPGECGTGAPPLHQRRGILCAPGAPLPTWCGWRLLPHQTGRASVRRHYLPAQWKTAGQLNAGQGSESGKQPAQQGPGILSRQSGKALPQALVWCSGETAGLGLGPQPLEVCRHLLWKKWLPGLPFSHAVQVLVLWLPLQRPVYHDTNRA